MIYDLCIEHLMDDFENKKVFLHIKKKKTMNKKSNIKFLISPPPSFAQKSYGIFRCRRNFLRLPLVSQTGNSQANCLQALPYHPERPWTLRNCIQPPLLSCTYMYIFGLP